MKSGGTIPKQSERRTAAAGLLPLCAVAFGCSHVVLSMGLRYWRQMPHVLLYAGYGLAILFAAALGRECLLRLRDRQVKNALLRIPGGGFFWGLAFLFFWMCLCALLTGRVRPGAFRANIGCLYDCGVSFFVLFPLGAYLARKKETRLMRRFFLVLVLIFALLSAYGLYAAFSDQTLPLGGGQVLMSKHRMEFPGNRLVLAANPNTTGMHCAALLMMVLFLLAASTAAARWTAAAAGLVIYAALALSDSRASILATGLGFGVVGGLLAWRRSKTRPLWFRIMAVLVLGAGTMFLFVKGRDLVYAVYDTVVPGSSEGPAGARDIMVTPGGDSTLGYRVQLIQASIRALLDDPELFFHGCGPYNVAAVLGEYGYPFYTHNQFMEVAMAYGVPAMALYILWLAALAMRSLKVGLSLREEQPMTGPILAVLLLVMVVNNLAEATLLFYRYFNGSVFFLTAGYICGLPAKPWFRRGS